MWCLGEYYGALLAAAPSDWDWSQDCADTTFVLGASGGVASGELA